MRRSFYRILLCAYPRRTRVEFGRDMEVVFAALCREQRGKPLRLITMCAREALDAIRSGMRQRRSSSGKGPAGSRGRRQVDGPLGGTGGIVRRGAGGDGGNDVPPTRTPARLTAALDRAAADVRFAARALRRSPAFAGTAVLTLALGIGANTSMFALVDATLLRPLPGVHDPGRLAVVYDYTRQRHGGASYPDYRDLREVEAFAGLAASTTQAAVLRLGDEVERISGRLVSANYFDVLGVEPALGRAFRADEDQGPGAHPVVVLSHSLWTKRFTSDPGVLGRSISVNGRPFEVVGVAPQGFRGAGLQEAPDVWVPIVMIDTFAELPLDGDTLDFRGLMMLSMIGRLADGVGLQAAQAAVDLQAIVIESAAPGMFDRPREFLLVSAAMGAFSPTARGAVIRYTGVLFGVTCGLLLIACINIGGLLAVRATARRREIAVRLALGAGRARLVQQLATEGLLLSLLGGVGGIVVAVVCLPLLELLRLPAAIQPQLAFDGRLLAFNTLLASFAGLVFGFAPALQATGGRIGGFADATAHGRAAGVPVRSLLVVTQVAVSALLLVGAGLLVRTVMNLASVDRGFDDANVLVAAFDLEQAGYEEPEGREFFRRLADKLGGVPGVQSAAVGTDVPLGSAAGGQPLHVESLGEVAPGSVGQSLVGPRYFYTLGVPLVSGRDLSDLDREGAPGVAMVNEAMARFAWPGEDARGKRVRVGGEGPWSTVVGVVRDYRHSNLREEPGPRVYWPIEQHYRFGKDLGTRRLLVRTAGRPLQMTAAIRTAVADTDPDLPLFEVTDMQQLVADTYAEERQAATLVGAFSLLALLLSAVGLFGVLAYAVGQRRREIGIRCALGARGAQVAGSVVRSGVGLAASGAAVGLLAAAAVGRVLSAWLFEIEPIDVPTFAAIVAVLLATAVAASVIPARRAIRVDPAVALRGD